jgi:parallel beta-helix repeat protein
MSLTLPRIYACAHIDDYEMHCSIRRILMFQNCFGVTCVMKRLIIASSLLLLACSNGGVATSDRATSVGAAYYVTQSGVGSGDGSSTTNAASIATFKAGRSPFDNLAGDTVYFSGDFTSQLTVPCAGSAGNFVTLDLTTARFIGTAGWDQIYIDKAYVRVQNALLIQIADAGAVPTGIRIVAENARIDNNTIVGSGASATIPNSAGIVLKAGGALITRNTISYVCVGITAGRVGPGFSGVIGGAPGYGNSVHDLDATPASNADGINVGSEGSVEDYTGFVVSYNTISEWKDDGIDLFNASNTVVEHNTVGPFTSTTSTEDGNGIKCGHAGSTGNIIRYNYIYDLNGASPANNYGIAINGANNIQVYGNLVVNAEYGILVSTNTSGHQIINNTFRSARYRGASIQDNVTSTITQNNIFEGGSSSDFFVNAGDSITGGYNLFINDTCNMHNASYYTNTNNTDLCATDPFFVSSTNSLLQSTSPCRDTGNNSVWSGIASITDYQGRPITDVSGTIVAPGGTVDIGAYEYMQ